MTIDQWNKDAFKDYAKPLRKLESILNKNRELYRFHAFVDPFGNKMVRASVKRITVEAYPSRVICIEWASPAEAVKIVEAGVRV